MLSRVLTNWSPVGHGVGQRVGNRIRHCVPHVLSTPNENAFPSLSLEIRMLHSLLFLKWLEMIMSECWILLSLIARRKRKATEWKIKVIYLAKKIMIIDLNSKWSEFCYYHAMVVKIKNWNRPLAVSNPIWAYMKYIQKYTLTNMLKNVNIVLNTGINH